MDQRVDTHPFVGRGNHGILPDRLRALHPEAVQESRENLQGLSRYTGPASNARYIILSTCSFDIFSVPLM